MTTEPMQQMSDGFSTTPSVKTYKTRNTQGVWTRSHNFEYFPKVGSKGRTSGFQQIKHVSLVYILNYGYK